MPAITRRDGRNTVGKKMDSAENATVTDFASFLESISKSEGEAVAARCRELLDVGASSEERLEAFWQARSEVRGEQLREAEASASSPLWADVDVDVDAP
jgi:hypothetical protein